MIQDFILWYAVVLPLCCAVFFAWLAYSRAGAIGAVKITAIFSAWWYTYIPLMFVSYFAVPVLMVCHWQGYTTWFGNRKYGIYGNAAMPCDTFLESWLFLCIRNPISNFGKEVLSVSSTATWPWHYDIPLFWRLWIKAGWKEVKDTAANPERTFVFRPYFK